MMNYGVGVVAKGKTGYLGSRRFFRWRWRGKSGDEVAAATTVVRRRPNKTKGSTGLVAAARGTRWDKRGGRRAMGTTTHR